MQIFLSKNLISRFQGDDVIEYLVQFCLPLLVMVVNTWAAFSAVFGGTQKGSLESNIMLVQCSPHYAECLCICRPSFSQSSHFQLFDNWEKRTDSSLFSSHMSDLYEMISKFWEQDIFSQNFAENWGKFRQRLTFAAFSLSQHYEERYTNK